MFSLRDFWNVSDKLYISNVLYLSLGSGGGRSISPTPSIDTTTGQQNLQKVYNSNMNIPYGWNVDKESSGIIRDAVNNHFWLGLLSTFDLTNIAIASMAIIPMNEVAIVTPILAPPSAAGNTASNILRGI